MKIKRVKTIPMKGKKVDKRKLSDFPEFQKKEEPAPKLKKVTIEDMMKKAHTADDVRRGIY